MVRSPLLAVLLPAVLLPAIVACSEGHRVPAPRGQNQSDASARGDGALADTFEVDAEPSHGLDASPQGDAHLSLDANPPPDGELLLDAGPFQDAAPTSDAGRSLDATVARDAGQACTSNGSRCATSRTCCPGFVCNGGTCRLPAAVCGPQGDTCALTQDCCPGLVCHSGQCAVCLSNRLPCADDAECCSGYCRSGYCGARPDQVTCEQLGDDCQGDVDNCCESASRCSAGDNSLASTRCCKLAFEACTDSLDCCGQMSCVNHTCRPVAAGDPCADHLDCSPSLECIEGRCEVGTCHGYHERCFSSAADGQGCCPGMMCFYQNGASTCILSIGSGLCHSPGETCADSGDCCFPGICTGQGVCEDFVSCAFPGASCTSGSQCCSGSCYGGRCDEVTPSCAGEAQLCGGAFGACCSGLSCPAGRCTQGSTCQVDGAACARPADCCTGRCTGNRCGDGAAGCLADQKACTFPSECCSGRCAGGVCVENQTSCASSGSVCGPSAACCTGLTCPAGRCEEPSGSCAGDSCASRSCCTSAPYCLSSSGGIFVWRCQGICGSAGTFCQSTADCCGGLVCQGQQCGDPAPCSGRSCTSGGDCCDHDNYCVDNACAPSCGSRGAGCGDDFDCCSMTCTSDRCE